MAYWGMSEISLFSTHDELTLISKYDIQNTQPIRSICTVMFNEPHIFVSLGNHFVLFTTQYKVMVHSLI